jgi:hypothetical protein
MRAHAAVRGHHRPRRAKKGAHLVLRLGGFINDAVIVLDTPQVDLRLIEQIRPQTGRTCDSRQRLPCDRRILVATTQVHRVALAGVLANLRGDVLPDGSPFL